MTKEEIKNAADEVVKDHFKSWFLLTDEEMEQNILNEESTPKGVIRSAMETVKAQIEVLDGTYGFPVGIRLSRYINNNLSKLRRILKELEGRI